ncbi:MAG TPA: hypothetical protein VE861_06460, partial [Gemmatimonadaceae bacterium]|nr:hypothetical protein [Gemmatimonadaceae bacterium]
MPVSGPPAGRADHVDGGVRAALHRAERIGTSIARGFTIFAVSVLLLPYTVVPVYEVPDTAPFTGSALLNPYATLGPSWQRANFHAHTRAWAGLTSGRGTPESVHAAYAAAGYDVIGISNYHQIDSARTDTLFLPVYEHGFSIAKSHQLLIGAREVTGLDFPLWQTTSAKQYLLGRMRDSTVLTAIAHPYLRNGYEPRELARLGGYDLLEVRSHWNDASAWWDSVLTHGNPIWAIGNDDSHDVTNPTDLGVVWTMANAPDARPASIMSALRAGAMYVVAGDSGATPAATVRRVTIVG